jgi:hypothetical protein
LFVTSRNYERGIRERRRRVSGDQMLCERIPDRMSGVGTRLLPNRVGKCRPLSDAAAGISSIGIGQSFARHLARRRSCFGLTFAIFGASILLGTTFI